MKSLTAILAASMFGFSPVGWSQTEQAAFDALCEEFGDCPVSQAQGSQPEPKVIIQKEVVYIKETVLVEKPVSEPSVNVAVAVQPGAQAAVVQNDQTMIQKSELLQLELLALRVSPDKRRIISQYEITNPMNKTLWVHIRSTAQFLVTDAEAKTWQFDKVVGVGRYSHSATRIPAFGKIKCQLIFRLTGHEDIIDDTASFIKMPLFVNGLFELKDEGKRSQFPFSYENIVPTKLAMSGN